MLRNHRSRALLLGIPILLSLTALGLAPLWLRHQDNAANAKPYGRYSLQEILNTSRTLCSNLVPKAQQLYLTSYPLITQNKADARLRRTWQVEYTDTTGKISGLLEWNADTGQLEQVSQSLPPDPLSSGHLSSERAADVSLYWVKKLDMAREQKWRLEGGPEYDRAMWKCQFLDTNARVLVIVRASD